MAVFITATSAGKVYKPDIKLPYHYLCVTCNTSTSLFMQQSSHTLISTSNNYLTVTVNISKIIVEFVGNS